MRYMKPLNLFQDLLKIPAVERGRLLGLDVGDKYVGLAVSDFNNKVASPLSVLVRKKSNIGLMALDFQHLINELSLSGFIVGYPYDRRKNSPNATQVKVFVDDLTKTGKLDEVPYTFWEECFSTKNVEVLLKPFNFHPIETKTISDKFAAVGILQCRYNGFVKALVRYLNLLPNMGSSMGSYKLNTSGVSREKHGANCYGGILRDERGCWIRGFMGHVRTSLARSDAEILAVFKGIELIDTLRLQNATLETDSLFAFDILEKPDLYTKSPKLRANISECQTLIKKNGITLSLITSEENKCAHFLAKLAMDDVDDEHEDVLDPPPGIETLMMADISHVTMSRS
ncbi:putative pre-16S rRNA nuclease [Tanacetum coccineum]|uniref:Pre-16S rRNA nuclease n=1 Tax=Tanacetum coccineum TaxID=301880 RepID=A0ABQ4ZJ06_9ASTR